MKVHIRQQHVCALPCVSQSAWPPGLPVDYDAPLSFTNFCTDLAVEMLSRGQMTVESTAGVYTVGGIGSSVWSRFFADDAVTRASLQGSRLRRRFDDDDDDDGDDDGDGDDS